MLINSVEASAISESVSEKAMIGANVTVINIANVIIDNLSKNLRLIVLFLSGNTEYMPFPFLESILKSFSSFVCLFCYCVNIRLFDFTDMYLIVSLLPLSIPK